MLAVISPAKSLNLAPHKPTAPGVSPEFLDDAERLVKKLRRLSPRALGDMMGVSQRLADLNHQRYAAWSRPFTSKNAKPAILMFDGDVYTGLEAASFHQVDFNFAQNHLRVLSGLYGVLRPLDLIQPYRLEMGATFSVGSRSLYEYWRERITPSLNSVLAEHKTKVLVNLASQEYFKAIDRSELVGQVVTPIFREIKEGKSRTIATFAKRARGRMAAWMIRNRVDQPQTLRDFNADGYTFVAEESTEEQFVFARPQPKPVQKR